MKTLNIFVAVPACLLLLLVVQNTHCAPLFEERFTTTTINLKDWYVGSTGSSSPYISVVDIGGGDFALKLSPSLLWGEVQIRAHSPYERGSNLRATFTVWHSNEKSPKLPDICGPWYNFPPSVAYLNQEAALVTDYPPVYGGPPFRLNQIPNAEWGITGLGLANGISTAWPKAISKASGIVIRVSLDDLLGAAVDYSLDGGITFKTDVDTRGVEGGSQVSGLYIGFFLIAATGTVCSTFIDDIVIENDNEMLPVNQSLMSVE